MNNIRFSYGDKKKKRMWIIAWIETGYDEKENFHFGYGGSIEIGLDNGIHTYVKGIYFHHNTEKGIPNDWRIAEKKYKGIINFDELLNGALEFAIEKGYCK